MKNNGPVTGNEHLYSEHTTIVSTTDLKGRITYANEDFIKVSGYSLEELNGKSHNIVRHPDMPPAAFADLWQTMKSGKSWIGIVNNRCKNGDNYWVDAFVAPVYEKGEIVGYQSVRAKPDRALVGRADKFYQKINAGKLSKNALSSFGITNNIFLGIIACLLPLFIAIALPYAGLSIYWSIGCALLSFAGAYFTAQYFGRPIKKAAQATEDIINNPIARYVYSGRTDEIGQLQVALHMQHSRLRTLVGRVADASHKLSSVTQQTTQTVETTTASIEKQNCETDQVAAAINELATTSQEIACNIETVAQSAQTTNSEADKIKGVVGQAIDSITQLTEQVEQSSTVIHKLDKDSHNIGKVLEVIQEIAEQTNLLALNAAIEAARAGEAGRGFAVVADEVRTLASRTAESTEEIQNMITQLQASAKNAVTAMAVASNCASESSNYVGQSGESLNNIAQSVVSICDMNVQIATAAEEQSAVAEEVNRNIHNISKASTNIAAEAHQTENSCGELNAMVQELENVVKQCEF